MKDSTKMFMLAALNLLFAMIPPFDWSSGLCIGVAIMSTVMGLILVFYLDEKERLAAWGRCPDAQNKEKKKKEEVP